MIKFNSQLITPLHVQVSHAKTKDNVSFWVANYKSKLSKNNTGINAIKSQDVHFNFPDVNN